MKKTIILITLTFLYGCSGLFYYPDSYFYSDPKSFQIEYEDIDFISTDKTKLHGWYLSHDKKVKKPLGLVVFFHGNAQNLSAHYLNLAWLTKEGYDIFIFDYRGYGLSEGQANQQGLYKDGLAALRYGHRRLQALGKDAQFIVYGQSLGGAVSLRVLKDYEKKEDIDLYVLDSSFFSYQEIAFTKLKNAGVLIGISPLAYLLVSDEYAALKYVDQLNLPLLVIHGRKDFVIPYEIGEEIFSRAKSKRKWFWEIEDGFHGDVFHPRHKMKYRKRFLGLLKSL